MKSVYPKKQFHTSPPKQDDSSFPVIVKNTCMSCGAEMPIKKFWSIAAFIWFMNARKFLGPYARPMPFCAKCRNYKNRNPQNFMAKDSLFQTFSDINSL